MIFGKRNKEDVQKELDNLKKAYEILDERYKKKTISLQEFSEKCSEINEKIEKLQKELK